MSEEQTVAIPLSLYKDLVRILNTIPNRKVNGLVNGKDTYAIGSILDKIGESL